MKIVTNFLINPILSLITIILTFVNFLIISIPFYFAIIPLIVYVKEYNLFFLPENILLYIIFGMFICTIVYLFLDMLLGFTIKHLLLDTHVIKDIEDFQLHQELFEQTLKRFEIKDVSFLVQEKEEINAYAVASFYKKYVVVTTGMLNHINETFDNTGDRQLSLQGLIAHELSHLLNWDFLPNLILIAGHNVSIYLDKGLELIIGSLIQVSRLVPFVGGLFALIMTLTYNIISFGLNVNYKYIIHPIYLLLERYFGRLIEYRSDFQSAQALSWEPIYLSLYSLLSLNGNTFHSNFSTHPNTISRILNIYKVSQKNKNISSSFLSKYSGLILITFVFSICCYSFFYGDKIILSYIKEFDILGEWNSTHLLDIFFNIKNYFINIYITTEDFIISSIYDNINDLLLYVILLILLLSILYIIKFFLLRIKLQRVVKNSNKTYNTPIDILLYYAIENNDIKSFIKVLEYGANINSTNFQKTLYQFTEEVNPKFIKYIKRINT